MSLYFSEDHEYVKVEGDTGTIGISDYAQSQLGDVVYAELPKIGDILSQGDQAGVVESVKSASEVYTPVSGEVIEINEALNDSPGLINKDPLDDGWFFKVKLSNTDELDDLKNEDDYKNWLESL